MVSTKTSREGYLVLVVDDDKILRQILCLSLSKSGFKVAEASDGREALEKYKELLPDAIMLDILMPFVDGFEVCKTIRKMPGGKSVPIVVITGRDDYDSVNKAFEAGATDFVAKPLNPLLLSYRISYIIRANKAFDDLGISEMKLASAQEMANLSNWEFDLNKNFLEWNSTVCQLFGRTEENCQGDFELFYDVIHQEDLNKVKHKIEKALQSNSNFKFEHRIINANNAIRILQQEGRILLDSNGNAVRILFTTQDITDRKNTEQEVKFLAYYDGLTKLPNRILFKEYLGKAVSDANRKNTLLANLFVDLDNFRIINNTFGRKVGDAILLVVADRLRKCLRGSDTKGKMDYEIAARFGADEFGVILENLNDLSDAAIVARRIIKNLGEVILIEGNEIYLHSRIGISVFPDDGNSVDDLMRNADSAMSRVKELNKDSYQFFTADLNSKAFARFSLETRLRKAIDDQEFNLLYQPQINLKTGKTEGVEALIRWQHPEMGIVSPMEFIPVAEDTGLIIPIGEWVMREACRQCKEWEEAGFAIRVSINLSAAQFMSGDLIEQVRRAISDSKAEPSLIEFEITESMLMHDVEGSIERMRLLKDLGLRLSIDDFGTGYSSLNYLKRFPVNALKVDRSFVSDIMTSEDDAMIVTAIVTLAQNLKLEVVAEGIEMKEHLAFLNKLGCDFAQGFLISRPVASQEVVKFYGSWSVDDL